MVMKHELVDVHNYMVSSVLHSMHGECTSLYTV